MNTAIAFALGSLVFSGLVDLTYKRYALRGHSRGLFLAGMGLIWLVLQGASFGLNGGTPTFDTVTLGFGVAAGITVTLSNLLLVESYTHLDISLGSTIYRLNTIAVVVMASLFLGESLAPLRLFGIGFGVVAVLFLYHPDSHSESIRTARLFLAIAVLASLLRATFGVVTKAALEAGADFSGILVIGAICWMVGGLAYLFLRERPVEFTRASMVHTVVAGFLVYGTVNTLAMGLARGDAAVVIPIANLGFVLALAVGVAWRMERLTTRKCVAMVLAIAAIVLLSRPS